MSKTFQAPATLTRLSFTSDGGLNLGFVTQELTAEEKLIAARSHRTFGYVLFKESHFRTSEVPEDDPVEEGQKTPRPAVKGSTLCACGNRPPAIPSIEPEDFYKQKMERIIKQIKQELEN